VKAGSTAGVVMGLTCALLLGAALVGSDKIGGATTEAIAELSKSAPPAQALAASIPVEPLIEPKAVLVSVPVAELDKVTLRDLHQRAPEQLIRADDAPGDAVRSELPRAAPGARAVAPEEVIAAANPPPQPTIKAAPAPSLALSPDRKNIGDVLRSDVPPATPGARAVAAQQVIAAANPPPQPTTKPAPSLALSPDRKNIGDVDRVESQTALTAYLRTPNRSEAWVRVLIERFYLSSAALSEPEIRAVYSDPVDYFGAKRVSLAKVAREKLSYYKTWPVRRFILIPRSLVIRWRSASVVDVSFNYRFNVASRSKTPGSGRGHANLTLDLAPPVARIIREDGAVMATN
jgi:hypothetical protein